MNNQDLLQLSEDRLERMDDVTIKSSTRNVSFSQSHGRGCPALQAPLPSLSLAEEDQVPEGKGENENGGIEGGVEEEGWPHPTLTKQDR